MYARLWSRGVPGWQGPPPSIRSRLVSRPARDLGPRDRGTRLLRGLPRGTGCAGASVADRGRGRRGGAGGGRDGDRGGTRRRGRPGAPRRDRGGGGLDGRRRRAGTSRTGGIAAVPAAPPPGGVGALPGRRAVVPRRCRGLLAGVRDRAASGAARRRAGLLGVHAVRRVAAAVTAAAVAALPGRPTAHRALAGRGAGQPGRNGSPAARRARRTVGGGAGRRGRRASGGVPWPRSRPHLRGAAHGRVVTVVGDRLCHRAAEPARTLCRGGTPLPGGDRGGPCPDALAGLGRAGRRPARAGARDPAARLGHGSPVRGGPADPAGGGRGASPPPRGCAYGSAGARVDPGAGRGLLAEPGHRPAVTQELPITYRGEQVGRLLLPRHGPRASLSGRDERLLADVVRQAAAAARASHLARQLQHSREQLVAAREEERRRLRRDLHDGLGPSLGAVALRIDTARNLLRASTQQADVLLRQARDETAAALPDARRLGHDPRPPPTTNSARSARYDSSPSRSAPLA